MVISLSPASLYLMYAASQPSDFSSCAASLTTFSTSFTCANAGATGLTAAPGAGAAGFAPGITTLAARPEAAPRTKAVRLRTVLFIDVSVGIHVGLRGRGALLPLEQRAVAAGFQRRLGEAGGTGVAAQRLARP